MARENRTIDAAIEYFSRIPWCAALIDSPNITFFRHLPRGNPANARDKFTVDTLGPQTNTILHYASFYKTPSTVAPGRPYRPFTAEAEIPELTTLYAVGDGATGWPGYAHGGLLSYMVDETAVALMAASQKVWDAYGYATHEVAGVTTDLSVRFRAPATVPGVFRSVARYKGVKGRRATIEVTISKEDGTVVATGEATWLIIDKSVQML
jgi:acyl-coenzyme A thioesterase PaaI-like protein